MNAESKKNVTASPDPQENRFIEVARVTRLCIHAIPARKKNHKKYNNMLSVRGCLQLARMITRDAVRDTRMLFETGIDFR